MAFLETNWYCNAGDQSTTGYYAVAKRPQNTAVVAGILRRQFTAPAVGSERVFVCIVAGTTANVTDATWTTTRGAKTTDGTATWQECTGQQAMNGDLANTPSWTTLKAFTGTASLGQIIKRNNGASYQICSTGGAFGASEPAFSDTAGVTTTESTTTWTSLGPVSNFTGGQAPFARLASVFLSGWFLAGNTVYVAANHAESQTTAITITPLLSAPTVGKIICHNHSGGYPPATGDLATTATISTSAAASITFNPISGNVYVYGISFIAGAGSGTVNVIMAATNASYYFDACLFKLNSTAASANLIQPSGTTAGVVVWNNCMVYFGNAANYIDVGNTNFTWRNTGSILAGGSAVPAGLFGQSTSGRLSSIALEAVDLSQITGALDKQSSTFETGNWLIKDCKLNASMTIPTPLAFGQTIQLVRSAA